MNEDSKSNNKGARNGIEHVCSRLDEAWFPINPVLHSRIQARLATNGYHLDALIEELKADAALFSYTLKELSKRIKVANRAPITDPVATLKAAGYQTLKSILSREPSDISIHDFHTMKKVQAHVLKNAMVGAGVAELIAPAFSIPKDTAYSCSILRQLGLALIAWNYPSVYGRAVGKGDGRDLYLTMLLGFSPATLAFTLVRKWGLSPDIERGMGNLMAEASGDPVAGNIGQTLEKVCRIGESIARYRDPDYPTPRSDWDRAREEIRKRLGPDIFHDLKKKVADATKYYVLTAPELFGTPPFQDAEWTAPITRRPLAERNPHILGCPPHLRDMFENLYKEMDQDGNTEERIDFLVKKIIPEAGYPRGCIFLVDIEYHLLVPRLAIGESTLDEFKSIRYNVAENRSNAIVRAFLGTMPIIGERRSDTGGSIPYVASSLGYLQKAGVLYLEGSRVTEDTESMFNETHKAASKALRQALTDCMDLD